MEPLIKSPAALKGVVGLRWFTVQDDTALYVHCDDGDFFNRIAIPKLQLEQARDPKMLVTSAVLALEGNARRNRLAYGKQLYGSKH